MIPLIAIKRRRRPGFALPSVLIASVVMMIVLVTAVAAVTTTRTGLNDQYYNQLAKEAAESGITIAEECVNDGVSAWANPLRPGSSCTGASAQCTDANCYVVYDTDSNLRSTFEVRATATASGVSLDAVGIVERRREADDSVWKTYRQILRADVGAEPLSTTSVTSGLYQVCAVLSEQTWCSGRNQSGQMGNGRIEASERYLAPERVMREPGALLGKKDKFVESGNQAACTVTTDNEIYCWGSTGYGMLGIGFDFPTNPYAQPVPTRVDKPAGMTGAITDIALSHHGGCAISGGDLWCWGRDHIGQTGSGGTNRSEKRSPVQAAVIGASRGIPVTDIASHVYAYHYCAVAGGKSYCWGDNSLGQLGDNSTVSNRTVPTLVHQASGALQGKTVTQVEVSRSIRMQDGSWTSDGEEPAGTYCDGQPSARHCYLQAHACALTSDGQMYCWGRNHYGQLGQGTWNHTIYRSPVRVRGALEGKFVRDIATSYHSSCALTTEPNTGNRFYCWGSNYGGVGGLGHGLMCTNSPASLQAICSPQPVVMETPGLQNKYIDSISGGVNRTCAVAEGVSYCAGINTDGQLGDGTLTNRDRPTEAKLFRQYRPLLVY